MKTTLRGLMVATGALAIAACSTTGTDTSTASASTSTQTTASAGAPMATPTPSTTASATAGANPMIGGAAMYDSKTIVQNAMAAPNLTTLVKLVQMADLASTLSGPGPYTVFAPNDNAFNRLAPGALDTLMKPENKATLAKVLTYHVVPGRITVEQIQQMIQQGGGTATLTTVEGEPLTFRMVNGALEIQGVSGNKSYVQTPDVRQSNGIVHEVNGVLIPTLG